jgi:hypothetical protein
MPKPLDPLLALEFDILEHDIIELHQMLGTLEDFYTLQPNDIKVLNRHAKRLELNCRELGHVELADHLSSQLDQLKTATLNIREKLRHKRYAHRDWVHALNQGSLPLIQLNALREVSRLMSSFLDTINVELTGCSFSFDSDNHGSLAQLAQTLQDYDKRVFASATIQVG